MRCERLHGTWSEQTCIGFQDADRIECRGCHHGAAIRAARNRKNVSVLIGKGLNRMTEKIEADVEELKKAAKSIEQRAEGGGPAGGQGRRAHGAKGIEQRKEDQRAEGQEPGTPDPAPEVLKQCSSCKKFKAPNLDNFGAEPKARDKFRYVCRVCDRIIVKNARLKKLGRGSEIVPIIPLNLAEGQDRIGPGSNRTNGRKKRSAASLLIEGFSHPGPAGVQDRPSIFKTLPPDLLSEQDPAKLPPSMCCEVDFNQYPFLYEFIRSGQERYLRSPENMILYAVKKFYDLANCRQGG